MKARLNPSQAPSPTTPFVNTSQALPEDSTDKGKTVVVVGNHLHDPGEAARGFCMVWEPTAPAIKERAGGSAFP